MECLATGFGLIEGPVWDAGAGLYFSDAAAGGVNLLDRAGSISTIVPKRRGVGGMAMHGADSLVMGGRDDQVVIAGAPARVLGLNHQGLALRHHRQGQGGAAGGLDGLDRTAAARAFDDPHAKAALAAAGVRWDTLPYAAVHKNGGGLHCSTTPLRRDPL